MNEETINENTSNEEVIMHQTIYPPVEKGYVNVELEVSKPEPEQDNDNVFNGIDNPFLLDKDKPDDPRSEKEMADWIKTAKEIMLLTESQWRLTQSEFSLTTDIMTELHKFNNDHKVPQTTETNEYDQYNGIDHMTYEESIKIFGEDHPIMGGIHTITIDRIKSSMDDLARWSKALDNYTKTYNEYIGFIEAKEDYNIALLQQKILEETDEFKKIAMNNELQQHYRKKYLDFLSDKLDDKSIERLTRSFHDVDKVKYLLEKAVTKLSKINISKMFIMEIAGFEKRFLPEKYHGQNNLLLLYFLDLCAFTKLNMDSSDKIFKIKCITIAMDKFIRHTMNEQWRERTIANVIELEDQFIGIIKPGPNDINSGVVDNLTIPNS
jgi:hypothetical protein